MNSVRAIKTYVISVMLGLLFVVLMGFVTPNTYASDDFSFDVEYDTNVKCGENTVFTIVPKNGSGTYMYFLNYVNYNDGTENYMVEDCTVWEYKNYQQSNQFKYVFAGSGTYTLKFYVMDKGNTPIKIINKIITINISDSKYPSVQEKANSVVSECMKKAGNSDYDRALWLHDWLIGNMSYDYSYHFCSAESALCRGKGTCESYHRAYTILLNKAGIGNERVVGNGHVWTAVRMDGEWYQVDATWDDVNYSTDNDMWQHLYFGLTDDLMKVAHSEHSPNSSCISNSLKNNYLIKSGVIKRWSDAFASVANKKIKDGETSFELDTNDNRAVSVTDILYPIVAYQLMSDCRQNLSTEDKLTVGYESGKLIFNIEYAEKPGDSDKPENKPSDQPADQPTDSDKPEDKPSDQPADQPADSDKPEDKPSEQPADQPTDSDKPEDKPSDQPADQPADLDKPEEKVVPDISALYVKNLKLTAGKKAFTVKWSKLKENNISGYQIKYSKKKSMKSSTYVKVGKSYSAKTIKKLKSKTRYYVKIRAYVKTENGTIYSKWSSAKSVKTK